MGVEQWRDSSTIQWSRKGSRLLCFKRQSSRGLRVKDETSVLLRQKGGHNKMNTIRNAKKEETWRQEVEELDDALY